MSTDGSLFRGVRVFDGERVLDADSVLVRGDRIEAIGRDLVAPAGAAIVDGTGRTLLPGLIDGHTHTPPTVEAAEQALRQSLAFGVTTVICLGTDPKTAGKMKRRAAVRPDLADVRSSGTVATVAGSHPTQMSQGEYPTLGGPEDVPAFVEAHLAAGMDQVKLVIEDGSLVGRTMPRMPPELSDALVAEAHAKGLVVVAHAQSEHAARQALRSGVDGLAHQYVDVPQSVELAHEVHDRGCFVTMTLDCYHATEGARYANDLRVTPFIQPAWLENLETVQWKLLTTPEWHANGVRAVAAARVLRDARVPIVAGTDAPSPGTAHGVSLHHELELLVRGGLRPSQALAAATSIAAESFRLNDRGRIRRGHRADLLLVDGDPTRNVTTTLNIARIWRGGVEFDRDSYRATLGR